MTTETRTAHTPGPWSNYRWAGDEHQISALGGTVALVSHSHSLISDEQADANARLIAAAPQLLEACREAHDVLILLRDAGLLVSETPGDGVCDAIAAAIATATT